MNFFMIDHYFQKKKIKLSRKKKEKEKLVFNFEGVKKNHIIWKHFHIFQMH